jgi:hypothetical protein
MERNSPTGSLAPETPSFASGTQEPAPLTGFTPGGSGVTLDRSDAAPAQPG